MNPKVLRKLQCTQLEIAVEIRRVCEENDINFFLDSGTLLGSVRHKGFIPWDDDLDIGMLRKDYDRFCEIAHEKLKDDFVLQTWLTDDNYPLPFGKVRKKGTRYIESKADINREVGIFVDIFPYDNAPDDLEKRNSLFRKLCNIERIILMKNHFRPWEEAGNVNIKKRIGYLFYQFIALFVTRSFLINRYETLVRSVKEGEKKYEQFAVPHPTVFDKKWIDSTSTALFEDEYFPIPAESDKWLHEEYGNYMVLPPEDQRENRHQVIEVYFG